MSQTYMGLQTFKQAINHKQDENDVVLLQLLEGVSRQIDDLLRRRFYPTIETKYFSGNGRKVLDLPIAWDLISVTTLKEDSNQDGTYDTTWATSDYVLGPYDADPTSGPNPSPYEWLEVDIRDSGNQDYFIRAQRAYELVGKFGYCELTEATGATINDATPISSSATALILSDGSKIDVGDTLLVESEYMYVTGEDVTDSNTVTVLRGVNGSTAVTHPDTTAVSKLVYPRAVVNAVYFQASRLWARRSSGFSSQIGFSDVGGTTVPQIGVDQDFWQMIERYKQRTAL